MRQTVVLALSSLALMGLVLALAAPACAADSSSGEKLARRWCAACHVVAADQREGNTQAAPFSAVAKLPGFDAGKLALFSLAPHPSMPDMSLTRDEAADLAAYINSQGR